jgi:hypothetical protein
MHHTLPSAETYHSNAPFFTSSKGLLCGLVGVLEETYFSERCQDEGRQGSIISDARVCRQAPLSRPTPCRPTPIATTALPFLVRVDADGVMECGWPVRSGRQARKEAPVGQVAVWSASLTVGSGTSRGGQSGAA